MKKDLYPSIFKRKSFHLFRNVGEEHLTEDELKAMQDAFRTFEPLCPETRVEIRLVRCADIGEKRDAEYLILFYSEKKDNYLMNVGFLGEQLDLWLVQHNIGTLWYGLGKTKEDKWNGLDFVIMMAIRKVSDETCYRKDMFAAKRKDLEELWTGATLGIGNIVRFAPSACNSQPWTVVNRDGTLQVYRYRKKARIGLMTPKTAFFFNRIDIGIFLCFLELCMTEKDLPVKRNLYPDTKDQEYSLVAEYEVK